MHEQQSTNMGLRPHVPFWQTSRFELSLAQPLIMGIVNLTPDSFSDGGRHTSSQAALTHAQHLLREGAHILDVGGESSRPGAPALDASTEWSRIQPVLQELVKWQVPISVDTYHAQTMQRALDLGVDIINDIWALRQPDALRVVAGQACGLCLMHMHGEPLSMHKHPMTGDAMQTVLQFFQERLQAAQAHGIAPARIAWDPGIGFGKTVTQNFALLREQSQLSQLGHPVLVGWSRKSSLGEVTGLAVQERLVPSVAAALLALERGAHIVRVHDVAATAAALAVRRAMTGI